MFYDRYIIIKLESNLSEWLLVDYREERVIFKNENYDEVKKFLDKMMKRG